MSDIAESDKDKKEEVPVAKEMVKDLIKEVDKDVIVISGDEKPFDT